MEATGAERHRRSPKGAWAGVSESKRSRWRIWFGDAARWLLLASLVYAPWAYGCTTVGTIRWLNLILAVAGALWFCAVALEVSGQKSGPNVFASTEVRSECRGAKAPPTLLLVGGYLLALGWWMTINARWIYDGDFLLFIPRVPLLGAGAGSVDYSISVAWMIRVTLLLGVVLLVAELSRDPVWLMRLWWTIAIAGGSIALLGLMQKVTGAPMIFWEVTEAPVTTFFSTYYAHGNAGAYLNLVLPATIALALRSFLRRSAPWVRAVAIVLCLLVIVATISNTSRGGQAIAVLLGLVLPFCLRDLLVSRARGIEKKTMLLAACVVGIAIVAIAGVSRLDQSLGRWHELEQKVEGDSRWLATRAAVGAMPNAGWFGFGPGTFRVVFPYYTNGFGPKVGGVWRFLHEDHLQTLMEWGWIGSAGWAFLFFGGMWMAVRTLRRREVQPLSGRQRLFLTSSVLALAGIALHALVDFPLQIASLQLYAATYVGVCWGLRPEG
jgi:hypothetical protein